MLIFDTIVQTLMGSQSTKLFLIDLDDTLIDTSLYKNLIFSGLSKEIGVAYENIEDDYKIFRSDYGTGDGWTIEFCDRLSSKYGSDKDFLNRIMLDKVSELKLINKTIRYMSDIRDAKILFSYGDKNLQEMKIAFFKLDKLFDKVIITSENKCDFVSDHINGNRFDLDGEIYKNLTIIDDKDYLYKPLYKHDWIKIINPDKITSQNE